MDNRNGRIFMCAMAAAFCLGLGSTLAAPYGFCVLPGAVFAGVWFCAWRPMQLRRRMLEVRHGKGAKSKDGEMFGVAANWYSEVAPLVWANSFFACLAGICTGTGLFLL